MNLAVLTHCWNMCADWSFFFSNDDQLHGAPDVLSKALQSNNMRTLVKMRRGRNTVAEDAMIPHFQQHTHRFVVTELVFKNKWFPFQRVPNCLQNVIQMPSSRPFVIQSLKVLSLFHPITSHMSIKLDYLRHSCFYSYWSSILRAFPSCLSVLNWPTFESQDQKWFLPRITIFSTASMYLLLTMSQVLSGIISFTFAAALLTYTKLLSPFYRWGE